ncbi:hypothetical protein [Bartonella schoenbuchensis]|uniref:hypothetical protein n=1 Tax=Bartonella schoenbuchensis TaxID=165694 RepID=UPI00039CBEDA|nr:hypothetical protein [Bartonella schoenbuchensis]
MDKGSIEFTTRGSYGIGVYVGKDVTSASLKGTRIRGTESRDWGEYGDLCGRWRGDVR